MAVCDSPVDDMLRKDGVWVCSMGPSSSEQSVGSSSSSSSCGSSGTSKGEWSSEERYTSIGPWLLFRNSWILWKHEKKRNKKMLKNTLGYSPIPIHSDTMFQEEPRNIEPVHRVQSLLIDCDIPTSATLLQVLALTPSNHIGNLHLQWCDREFPRGKGVEQGH